MQLLFLFKTFNYFESANLQLFFNNQIFTLLFLYNRKKRFLPLNKLGIVIFVD